MISTLKKRGEAYYCTQCMMRQPDLKPNCYWCGSYFSNLNAVLIKEFKEKENKEIEDYESDICRRD
jgi:predicted ATP-dependent serine protease